MKPFATLEDVTVLSGNAYTQAEQDRITALLPLVSDALRVEAGKVGKDLDMMVMSDPAYKSVVKLVTVDIAVRVMRQSLTGDPISQLTESALGYSATGTFAVPGGGGIAAAIMRNDLKRLGFRRQQAGVVNLWPDSSKACR